MHRIYSMNLHQQITIYDDGWGTVTKITRVPGGWVYTFEKGTAGNRATGSCFVPYNEDLIVPSAPKTE